MNFKFENQGNNTYLVAELPTDMELDTMTLGMITNNAIEGLASAVFTQLDNTKYMKYNISAKISLGQLFEGSVNKKKVIGVFSGICNALQNAEEYMLEFSSFMYDMDKIFVNVSTLEVSLICVPVMAMKQNIQNVKTLFKNIMFSAQFDPSENNDYVGKILNSLNSTTAFSIDDFKATLDSLNEKAVTVQSAPVHSAPQTHHVAAETVAPVNVHPRVEKETVSVVAKVENIAAPVQPVVPELPKAQPVIKPGLTLSGKGAVASDSTDKKKKGFSLFGNKSAAEPKEKADKKVDKKADKKADKKTDKRPNNVPYGMAIPGMPSSIQSTPVTPQPAASDVQSVQPAVPQGAMNQQPVASVQPMVTVSGNFGETTVLGVGASIGETTVLGVAQGAVSVQPHLIRRKNDERIPIAKPVFRIGKEKSYVDYFIGDNTAISRSHANVIIRDGEYFVVDTNSTNHTYVNDNMLQSNVENKISHGDVIRLANEDFEFRLY